MQNGSRRLHFMAIDCCEHVLATLGSAVPARLTSVRSNNRDQLPDIHNDIDLIVVGVSRYPVRRLFISQLRRVCPNTPLLVLRREEARGEGKSDRVRGEFLLSDRFTERDCDIITALRDVIPFRPCKHMDRANNFDVVREVLRVLSERYSDPSLDLKTVARALPISASHLSRILNQQVGVNFRQLLRHVRIEEAKRMLSSRELSVKEVAARVGFSDTHYFSRSFKEMTGVNATEYRARDILFG